MVNIFLGSACICLLIAAFSDLYRRRISNSVVIAVLVMGLVYKLADERYNDLFADFIPLFVVLAVGFVAFQCRVLAGGDVKLLSVSAYFVGLDSWLVLCLWTAVFGGVLGITLLLWQLVTVVWSIICGQKRERQRLDLGMIELPYGVAIAAAALTVIVRQKVMGIAEVIQ